MIMCDCAGGVICPSHLICGSSRAGLAAWQHARVCSGCVSYVRRLPRLILCTSCTLCEGVWCFFGGCAAAELQHCGVCLCGATLILTKSQQRVCLLVSALFKPWLSLNLEHPVLSCGSDVHRQQLPSALLTLQSECAGWQCSSSCGIWYNGSCCVLRTCCFVRVLCMHQLPALDRIVLAGNAAAAATAAAFE